jgi:putative colanic acid biosynthesis acetyltransferase WcaF
MNSHEPNPNADQTAPPAEPPRKSPWSMKAKVLRLCWGIAEILLWKLSPTPMWGFRRALLRAFGAKVGKGVRVHPSVKVIIPWNIELGDGVVVHERAILYALGEITVGQNTEIGPLAHICAGTHDYTDPAFTLLRQPISIGADSLIGIACFVAPNIAIAEGTVLEPRCAIYMNTEPGKHYIGNPGKLAPAAESDASVNPQAVAS